MRDIRMFLKKSNHKKKICREKVSRCIRRRRYITAKDALAIHKYMLYIIDEFSEEDNSNK